MAYWQAVRTPYSTTNKSAIHQSEPMIAPRRTRKKSFVKKLRNWGNAKSMQASTVAHTRSNTNRKV